MLLDVEKIKGAIEKSGMSQAQIARRLDMGEAHLARFLKGQYDDPRFSTVCKLADLLGLSLDKLRLKD